ncbi:MAG: hypothetical protein LBE38_04845 [Deltaproteobacteria bacterium]|nr:hypothetical protein [Deltaproteobacteria bacterium]
MKKGNIIKLALLLGGLFFLFWWGWSGNFIFNPSSLFTLTPSDDYYVFKVGGNDMGFSHRVVEAPSNDGSLKITEDSLINLNLAGLSYNLRVRSNMSFGPDGRPISAEFTIPGFSLAKAEAKLEGGNLNFKASLGPLQREVNLPAPPEGPVLISGVVPWLSHQEIPLGKVLLVSIFDPMNMRFTTGELMVTDDSRASDEVQVFKVTIKVQGTETTEWLDATGRLFRQRMDRMDAGLDLIREEGEMKQRAILSLSQEPPELEGQLAEKMPDLLKGLIFQLPSDFFSNTN